ncbi:MAG: xanthine dehydrogenase family protein molybdopterin-binding subunit [Betaproteobacteria bacterium]|nr:xanthine dehydrogenase family protein molybdopterin-binding subunit [Betaproteobacteria bacterium]
MTNSDSESLIGASIRRPKARQLAAGRGRYTDDLRIPGLLHAAFLRSPHAHARIVSVELARARALPGIVAAYQAADLLAVCKPWTTVFKLIPGHQSAAQSPLAHERALWQGQPVVIVIAESRAIAEDGIALIEIEWESLPALSNGRDALAVDAPVLHPALGNNMLFEHRIRSGNPEAAFAAAAHVVRRKMRFPRHTGVPLEARTIVAEFDPTQRNLTVHASTQAPHQMRDILAKQLGLDESRVRVVVPDVGGGFGIKLHAYDDEIALCAAALLLGRPVKFASDRLEAFASDNHARAHEAQAAIAVAANGEFLAFTTDDIMEAGAFSSYPRSSALEGLQAVNTVGAPYAAPAFAAHIRVAFQNKPHTGSYRGVGQPIGCAVTEMLVDAAARAIDMDPAEIRRINYRSAARSGNITPGGVDMGGELSQAACLDKLLALMDYPKLRAEQAEARKRGRYLGIGFASFTEATATGPMFYGASGIAIAASDGCSVRLEPGGTITCVTSAQFQGQGLEVGLAQLVAQSLSVPFDSVTIIHGDTAVTPMGGGSYASRGLAIGGEAAMLAAGVLRERILAAGSALLEVAGADLELREGSVRVRGTDRALPLSEVGFAMHYSQHVLPADIPTDPMVTRHYASPRPYLVANGIQASLAEVDPDSGFVRLLRHWVADDCGRLINPMLADEQIRGAVVQGLGAALFEECLYDSEAQLLSATMADYLVPMAADMPDIDIGHVETPVPGTLLGAKGVGEAGVVGAAAAVANAVNDALAPLGAEVLELPITPERVLRALRCVP